MKIKPIITFLIFYLLLSGCATTGQGQRTKNQQSQTGSGIGTLIGGALPKRISD